MKYFLSLFLLVVLLSSCEKSLLPAAKDAEKTGKEIFSETSIQDISDQTGIGNEDLKSLMDIESETSLLSLFSGSILARGTEPFWSFTASGSNLIWLEPGVSSVETTLFTPTLTQSGSTIIISASGLSGIISSVVTCSDGMSDTIYTHTAQITKGTDIYNGCANIE